MSQTKKQDQPSNQCDFFNEPKIVYAAQETSSIFGNHVQKIVQEQRFSTQPAIFKEKNNMVTFRGGGRGGVHLHQLGSHQNLLTVSRYRKMG